VCVFVRIWVHHDQQRVFDCGCLGPTPPSIWLQKHIREPKTWLILYSHLHHQCWIHMHTYAHMNTQTTHGNTYICVHDGSTRIHRYSWNTLALIYGKTRLTSPLPSEAGRSSPHTRTCPWRPEKNHYTSPHRDSSKIQLLMSSAHRESSLKKPLWPTISFLPTQIECSLFVLGDFCGASSCSRTGCRQVARYMHDPNGIIDARSAGPLAPDLMPAISDEGLWNLASSLCMYRLLDWG